MRWKDRPQLGMCPGTHRRLNTGTSARKGVSTVVSLLLLTALIASFVIPFMHLYLERMRYLERKADIELATELLSRFMERAKPAFRLDMAS